MKTKPQPSDLEMSLAAFLEAESHTPDLGAGAQSAIAEDSALVAESTIAAEAQAEEALFALFAALPTVDPQSGFTSSVLRRAGVEGRDLGWIARFMTAAAYAIVLAGAWWSLPIVIEILTRFELAAFLKSLVDLFSFCIARLGDLVIFAERLVGFGRVLWLILTSPPVVLASTLCAALTLLMGRWLAFLLAVPRSSLHAAAR